MLDLLEVLACPECNQRVGGEGQSGFRCDACGTRYPSEAEIPALVPKRVRELIARGEKDGLPLDDRAGPSSAPSSDDTKVANIIYHSYFPEEYGNEALASLGMFDEQGACQQRLHEAIRELARLTDGELLIDVGTGSGNVLKYGKRHFKKAIGVDLCVPILRRAASAGHPVLIGDAYHLPFRDGSVSAVTAFSFLHHLDEPERFLAEAARVLKPGGRIYTDWDPNGETRHRSTLFKALRGCVVEALSLTGLSKKPRYYHPNMNRIAQVAEYGWHFGKPLDGREFKRLLEERGMGEVRLTYHNDCASLDRPRESSLGKKVQRTLTLLISGDVGLLLGGFERRAEYFAIQGRKS